MQALDLNPKRIYHITTAIAWDAAQANGQYTHPTLVSEGFIHCSYPQQVQETLRLHFPGQAGLVLLEINPQQLTAPLRSEISRNGESFPHLYGVLNLSAVERILSLSGD